MTLNTVFVPIAAPLGTCLFSNLPLQIAALRSMGMLSNRRALGALP